MLYQEVIFTKSECDSIINSFYISSEKWKNIDRSYESNLIQCNDNTKWIFDRLVNFFEKNSDYSIINLKKEIHFHIFKKNDWFGLHNDSRDFRLFSIGVILNDDYSGGEFKIYDSGESLIKKEIGNTYVFNVETSHEVTKITDGIRYSLIWFIQNNHIKTRPNKLI
jgi:predicted 2-oxoglutarate/Fe(II)-dependent dioxygenase YbiX